MQQKPYRDLSTYYQQLFGTKVAKISLDAGFTCPNRDGTKGTRGCIFCSMGGSGDFATSRIYDIETQIEQGKSQTSKKWKNVKYIAYFQAFTNTYAPIERLKAVYEPAIKNNDIVGISIATRPDCLSDDVIAVLSECNQNKKVWVELGLQTIHESTAQWIRRGYDTNIFAEAVKKLHAQNISVVVHVILGLPNECTKEVLETISYLNELPIEGIKLQLLHVLSDTDFAQWYRQGKYTPLTKQQYIDLVCTCISHLREDIVIHRLTGDGNKKTLIAPLWSLQKRTILNEIHHKLKEQNIQQGCALSNL